jgi:hypothetical protein
VHETGGQERGTMQRRLVLLKGAHQYVFRVREGLEAEFVAALVELAEDDRWDFDWQDVAFFCRLIGRDAPSAAESSVRTERTSRF